MALPPATESALLREHAYESGAGLEVVLDARKSVGHGGFKPISDYGLGYFNYYLREKDMVRNRSLIDMLRGNIYDYFPLYFIVFAVVALVWCACMYAILVDWKRQIPLVVGRLVFRMRHAFSLRCSKSRDSSMA